MLESHPIAHTFISGQAQNCQIPDHLKIVLLGLLELTCTDFAECNSVIYHKGNLLDLP